MVIQADAGPFATVAVQAIKALNGLPASVAEAQLLTLCGSRRWAAALCARRPFEDAADLEHEATNRWFLLDERDWLEAFACHPRIGETAATGTSAGFAKHSSAEQAAARETLAGAMELALVEGNRLYEARFGFLYIVFASGRTAADLLALLYERLKRDRVTELHEAARQQHEITMLRVGKWLAR